MALLVLWLFVTPAGNAIRDILGSDVVRDVLTPTEMRTYNATTEGNLRSIHTALMIYHDSEGQFPDASGWMDAIVNRMQVDDMGADEAAKKLKAPSLVSAEGQYGYAMNEAASGQYSGDLSPKLPLVFDSSDTKRNAKGSPDALLPDPPRDGQNFGIAVDGTLLKL